MRTKHHIIYIPGLADTGANLFGQVAAMAFWRIRYGISTHVMHIGWADNEDFEDKLARVVRAIDAAKQHGCAVSIVAASAGASMAIHAFAKRPQAVHRVVTIVGAHGPVQHANPTTLTANPALKDSLQRQPAAIHALTAADRGHILSIKPLTDNIVSPIDMNIQGINYLNLSTNGHLVTIAAALTIYSTKIILFIKRSV